MLVQITTEVSSFCVKKCFVRDTDIPIARDIALEFCKNDIYDPYYEELVDDVWMGLLVGEAPCGYEFKDGEWNKLINAYNERRIA